MVRRAPLVKQRAPVLTAPQVYQARWSNITVAAKVLVDMQRGAMHGGAVWMGGGWGPATGQVICRVGIAPFLSAPTRVVPLWQQRFCTSLTSPLPPSFPCGRLPAGAAGAHHAAAVQGGDADEQDQAPQCKGQGRWTPVISSTAGPQAQRKADRKHCIDQPRYWPCCSACRVRHPHCGSPCYTHAQVVSFLGICCIPPCILTGASRSCCHCRGSCCKPRLLPRL